MSNTFRNWATKLLEYTPDMNRRRIILLALFAGTGCAALIYEIVWLQMLELVIGSSAVSLAALLGTFMGGMCLGSLLLPRLISVRHHPLRVYAALELLAAFFGVAVLYAMPWIRQGGAMQRGLICAFCLLPPTLPMGATLPALARFVGHSQHEARWWGFFYGANIAGGVAGCLLAGFWLLRVFDMAVASCVAVGLNLFVAAIAFTLSRVTLYDVTPEEPVRPAAATRNLRVYLVIGLSGLTALGAEVLWTRLLALTLGPTVYTFSIILAVFLIGLGLGSAAGSLFAKRFPDPGTALAASQALLVIAIAWAAWMIAGRLPYWDRNLSAQANPWLIFASDFLRCGLSILPAAFLWGASFPLALASAAAGGREAARTVGQVYSANTLGAIVGAVAFSLFLVPQFGSRNAEGVLIALTGISALILFRKRIALTVIPAALLLIWVLPGVPWQLIAFGQRMTWESNSPWKKLYVAEGINSSIAYTEWIDKRHFFHVAGKVEASSTPSDMKLQRMLGHIPALIHGNARSVLIVGCGAGVTAGTFVVHPEVARITLCEIEPLIPPNSDRFFNAENHGVVHDRRTHIVFDDARHFVLTTPEKFDIITSDPIHPWVKGAATLYSKEYFEAVRAHLNPGGLVTQWVPLYQSDKETVRSEIATFFEVFPHGVVWGNLDEANLGYDVVLLGSDRPIRIDLDAVDRQLKAAPRIAASLHEVGFVSAADMFGTLAAQSGELTQWLKGAQINRDISLRLQYLAGMAVNQGKAALIYDEISKRGAFPPDLFTGSPEQLAAVHKAFDAWRSDYF
jgi:spermidine synthase